MKLLRIDSSARTASVTRQLTARAAEEWKKNYPGGEVIYRDLSVTHFPPITDDWSATHLEASRLSPAQRSYLSTSDQMIEEVRAADTIVIGAPMYNFSISSLLKAWIDQIVRIGMTFGYGPDGPRGLLQMKKVIVITAREARTRRALRERYSISRSPTFGTFSDSLGSPTSRSSTLRTRAGSKPPHPSGPLRKESPNASAISTGKRSLNGGRNNV